MVYQEQRSDIKERRVYEFKRERERLYPKLKRERDAKRNIFSLLNSEPITSYLKTNKITSRQRGSNKQMRVSTRERINNWERSGRFGSSSLVESDRT